MVDDVDEFAVRMLGTYLEKPFKSVADNDLNLSSEEEKKQKEEKEEASKALLKAMADCLDGKVKEVRLSDRLISSPVCLTSEGPLSIEMEKVLKSMPMGGEGISAERILELHPNHPVFAVLSGLDEKDDRVRKYAELLYEQALLIEGLPIPDPVAFSNAVCELMK